MTPEQRKAFYEFTDAHIAYLEDKMRKGLAEREERRLIPISDYPTTVDFNKHTGSQT